MTYSWDSEQCTFTGGEDDEGHVINTIPVTATAADVEKATKLLRYLEALEPDNEQRWNWPNYRGSKALEILSPSNSFYIEVRVQPSKYVCVCACRIPGWPPVFLRCG